MTHWKSVTIALATAAVGSLAISVAAQESAGERSSPFDNPQNLQALPEDISAEELLETMRGFSFATGLRCNDCHASAGPDPRSGLNFPSDEKRQKQVARQMIRMVADINTRLDGIEQLERSDASGVRVECSTCHRGVEKPEQMRSLLDGYRASDDPEGAVARYTQLREEYFGSAAYDFSAFTLGQYASDVTDPEHPEFALALHRMNIAFNPDDPEAYRTMGESLFALGRLDEAIATFERGLERNPDSRGLRFMLERARSAREE